MFNSYCEDYHYVCSKKKSEDGCAIQTHLYSFRLPKNNHRYIVEVEEYVGKVFILKFYKHDHRLSERRFNILTGDNQAPKIVSTVFLILYEIWQSHPTASFAFMGAPIKKGDYTEVASETKRLTFYKRFLHNRLGEATFEFLQGQGNSIYFLKNKSNPELDGHMDVIGRYLYDNYEDLDIALAPVVFPSQTG